MAPHLKRSSGCAGFSDGFIRGQTLAGHQAVVIGKPNFYGDPMRRTFGRLTGDAL